VSTFEHPGWAHVQEIRRSVGLTLAVRTFAVEPAKRKEYVEIAVL